MFRLLAVHCKNIKHDQFKGNTLLKVQTRLDFWQYTVKTSNMFILLSIHCKKYKHAQITDSTL